MASFGIATRKGAASNDEYYTPPDAFAAIAPFIPVGAQVWEPFQGASESAKHMAASFPCDVVSTEEDFYERAPPVGTTMIVSNPPYSQKLRLFNRLRELQIPFMLLLPVGTFTKQFIRWAKDDLQLIVPSKRIHFVVGGEQTRRTPFDVVWVCVGCHLEKDITYL